MLPIVTYDKLLANGFAISNPVLETKTWNDKKTTKQHEAKLLLADMYLITGDKYLLQIWGINAERGMTVLK